MKIMKSLSAGLIAGSLTFAAGIGQAQAQTAPAPVRTVAVHYGDLDLGSTAGRGMLEQRIRQAVRSACGTASPADLQGQNQAAACRRNLQAGLISRRDAVLASARPSGPATLVASR